VRSYSFGLVSYLNTSPFRFGLRELGQTRWRNEVPSRLLALLQEGDVEAAILPAFDVLRHPELPVLPGSCIASRGGAHSVKLFSRIPLGRATTVALDASSHTSAALTRIVFGLQQRTPSFVEMDPDLPRMLAAADAALLIGDPCMRADTSGLLVTDLGEEWLRLTGLPFVFALWAARPDADCAELTDVVTRAKWIGVAQVERVAQEESERVGLPRDICLTYLRDHMRYDLDQSALAGLERFRRLAVDQGLIPDAGPIRTEPQTDA
jgi:chorismate dehydratase